MFRFADSISNALNLLKKSEEFLTLDIYNGGTCIKRDFVSFTDFATSVSPLKASMLAEYLQVILGVRGINGCVKVEQY